ncbi:hypothetical protein [Nesterenkonia pannonica]|nr:hypothetical protein [Nesterenkonia pannonica]
MHDPVAAPTPALREDSAQRRESIVSGPGVTATTKAAARRPA